ncbi:MAG: aquaporin [Candidatus Eisenbacteria bacterium]|uniref:Aquaporin n=1 Tax=Eiseniibacteriota bacterium TaxID=2212470 RepID=A0A849SLB6_UNCEI|nr:aquaporin [Candidatus Eisenbacteria bacterium]
MDQGFKSYWAEFLGTFTLCFLGQGAICANELLGADGPGLLGIAVAHGLALAVMISALGATSGAHFNPAVTLGFVATGRQKLGSGMIYIVAQLIGAVFASWLLTLIFPPAVWQVVRLGAAGLAPELAPHQGVIAEIVMTFLLVTAVWGTAVDPRGPKIGGFAIGLVVLGDILVGGPLTGAAMNPARAFGPAVIAGAWELHWIWWLGPIAGGVLAARLYHVGVLSGRRD